MIATEVVRVTQAVKAAAPTRANPPIWSISSKYILSISPYHLPIKQPIVKQGVTIPTGKEQLRDKIRITSLARIARVKVATMFGSYQEESTSYSADSSSLFSSKNVFNTFPLPYLK